MINSRYAIKVQWKKILKSNKRHAGCLIDIGSISRDDTLKYRRDNSEKIYEHVAIHGGRILSTLHYGNDWHEMSYDQKNFGLNIYGNVICGDFLITSKEDQDMSQPLIDAMIRYLIEQVCFRNKVHHSLKSDPFRVVYIFNRIKGCADQDVGEFNKRDLLSLS